MEIDATANVSHSGSSENSHTHTHPRMYSLSHTHTNRMKNKIFITYAFSVHQHPENGSYIKMTTCLRIIQHAEISIVYCMIRFIGTPTQWKICFYSYG